MAKSFALFNNLKTYDFEEEDICKIIKILKDRKIIISAIRPKTKKSILIDDILETFWNYEESPYVKSMAAETGKIISMSYCKTCESRVRLYWLPALKGKYIGEITKDDLKAVLSEKRIQTLAPKTINGIIDSITIPLKWAFNEGYTENICYEGLRRKITKSQERHILTMDEAENLFHGDYWDNDAARVANRVTMHTGMRAREIAALRIKDIQPDGIHVGSSWCKYMGLKSCKNGEERDIPIPISDELREELMIQAQMNPYFDGDESFIFFGMDPTKPACSKQWNKYLKRALTFMKYPNPKEICFHSWRQFFCSRMLDVIPDKRVVMALSGQKTTAMLDHYGKHLEQEKTLAIAKEAGLEKVPVIIKKFDSRDETIEYEYKMQLNSRRLTDGEYFAAFLKFDEIRRSNPNAQGSSDEVIGRQLNKSARQVCKMREIAKKADTLLLEKIQNGSVSINKAHEMIKAAEAKRKTGVAEEVADEKVSNTGKGINYDSFKLGVLFVLSELEKGRKKGQILKDKRIAKLELGTFNLSEEDVARIFQRFGIA